MKRTVILTGKLAKLFGKEHSFDIATPAEAIRALSANFSGFSKFLIDSEKQNIAYKVIVDQDVMPDVSAVHNPFSKVIRIVPVIMGGKSGFLGIVLGAALIAASFFLPGAALFTIGSFAPSLASIAFGLGATMVLGGVSQLLSPHPKAQGPIESPENRPSYTFNGPINTTSQGQPVPVGYGRLIVGSSVISAGITADEYGAAGVS